VSHRLASLVLAALTTAALAQGPTDAALRGRILDRGRPAAATLQLTPLGFAPAVRPQNATTASNGFFLLQRLPPGLYHLHASSPGGLTADLTVALDAGTLADLTLSLNGPQAAPALAELAALSAAAALEPSPTESLLDTLPVPDRQPASLTQLDPATHTAQPPDDPADDDPDTTPTTPPDSAFNGLGPTQNRQSLDGLSNQQHLLVAPRGNSSGSSGAGPAYGQSALRSLRVLPQTFSARYGAASGLIALSSRGATSRLHGSAFLLARSSILAATNPFSIETHYNDGQITAAPIKPNGLLTHLGGSIGAPIAGSWLPSALQGRLAAFASLDLQLHDDRIVSTPSTANFYNLSATQLALLGNRGVSTAATHTALDYLDSLTGTTTRHATRLNTFTRADTRLTARDTLALTYLGAHFDAPSGVALGQASDAVVPRGLASLGDSHIAIDAVTARWLHTFSQRLTHELRFQLSHDLEFQSPHAPLPQEPAIGPGGYAPQVSIAPEGFAYGTPSSLGRIAYPDELRLQLANDLQLRLGHHLLSLGADWSRLHDRIASIAAAFGAFSYDSSATNGHAGGLVDWISDFTFNVHAYPNGACPTITASVHDFCFRTFTQSFGPTQTTFVTHELSGFLEDNWRIRDNLTLTAGLRFDYTLLPLPQTPNYTLDAALDALALPIVADTHIFPEDRNNLGPRIGLAWSPHWLTAQLGYGLFYGSVPGATVRAALADTALATTTLHVRIRPTTVTPCPQITATQQGFGYPCDYTSTPPAAVATTSSAVLFAHRYRSPAVQRASLSLARPIGHRLDLRLTYALAIATQLPNSVDLNIAPTTATAQYTIQGGDAYPGLHTGEQFTLPRYTQRPLTAYGPLTALVSNVNATYHAATVEVQTRPTRALHLRAAYTFSRAIDTNPSPSAVPPTDNQFDPFTHGYDKGLSSQHIPHRLVADALWQPALTHGPAALQSILSRWTLAALAIASSGAPYSYQVFGGPYLTGGRESLNASGGATYLPTVGRNTLRLPAHARLDLRLQRAFQLPHRLHAEAYAQAFNLLNTQTVTSVQTRAFLLGTPLSTTPALTSLVFQDAPTLLTEGLTDTLPFAAPRSSTSGFNHERQLELGLRLRF
jgi:hypothetical protein